MAAKTIWEQFDLKGKTALVTGATGYLGQAMATALAEAGADIVISSRDKKKATAAAEKLAGESGRKVFAVQIDHFSETSIKQGFEDAVQQAGRIDVLVNNGHWGELADWRHMDAEKFNKRLSNITGYFLLARLAHDHAVANERTASIVMLGSMYGITGGRPEVYEFRGVGSNVAYHAYKAAVLNMVRHLAVYWGKDNVRVNCLSPGPFPPEALGKQLMESYASQTPLRRIGRPEELKGAIVFLASEASSFMTGSNLVIDGGWTAS